METAVDCDIAIVGAGLSGTIAAIVLARAGHRVTLIDRNEVVPPEFRVEKIGGDQLLKLDRLGLLPALVASATRFDAVINARRGRVVDHTRSVYHGIRYQDLVTAMRRELPPAVSFVVGRVTGLATSADRQTVTIADRVPVTARLVVLASGLSDILRSQLGIEREVLREKQSLTFGFDLRPVGGTSFGDRAVTYYGETPADGVDYITLFPIAGATRANLFSFLDYRDPWVKALRADPDATLHATLPGLERLLGAYEVEGKVSNWIMDLSVARNVRQPGIVLIGDAFQTSCPAAGTGVSRLLTDIEQLRLCASAWLATPGMGTEKIAEFYDDPTKQAMDAHALGMAEFRHDITVDRSFAWSTRRRLMFARRSVLNRIDAMSPALAAQLRRLRA